MTNAITIDFRKTLRRHVTMTFRVKGLRGFGARIWVGTRLIKLAAWIIGVGVVVEVDPTS